MGILGIDLGLGFLFEKVLDWAQGRQEINATTRKYLNYLINESSDLGKDWIGKDQSFLLDIERAFVPVQLIGWDGRSQSLRAILAAQGHDRLVIQGQPGAGKSSLSRFVTWVMAQAANDSKKYAGLPREKLNCPPLFPLRIELKECEETDKPVRDVMLTSVSNLSPEYIEQRLMEGNVLVLFDGLDEVGDSRRKYRAMEEICKLTNLYHAPNRGNRFLATTRPAGYDHSALATARYELYTLGELAPDQQRELISRYYELWSEKRPTTGQKSWQTKANELVEYLDELESGMSTLRGNPLLLSQIAKLHFEGKRLPARRHELYNQCICELVSRRDRPYRPSDQKIDKYLSILGDLALAMHKGKSTRSFSGAQVHQTLRCSLRSRNYSTEPEVESVRLLEDMEKRWGLLINHGEGDAGRAKYRFLYPTFREYLAAWAVHRYPDDYWPLLKANLNKDWWKEVVLFYTAMPTTGKSQTTSPLDKVLAELIDGGERTNHVWIQAGQLLSNDDRQNPSRFRPKIIRRLDALSYGSKQGSLTALESLCHIRPDGCSIVLERIQSQRDYSPQSNVITQLNRLTDPIARQNLREAILAELDADPKPKIKDRVLLAEVLGQIGDTRLGELVDISPVLTPRTRKAVIKITKYPITNIEYARFVEDTDRTFPAHWTEDGYPRHLANHPVTYVSFTDAKAYCQWRSESTGQTHRLPTKSEWIAAATGNKPGQCFPWGNENDQYRFNWRKSMEGTTPVGVYAKGESALGIADLLGNVWEWTQSRTKKQYILRRSQKTPSLLSFRK